MANIREMRKRAGLTQVEVAKVLEISIDTLWRWETGASEPRATDLLRMSKLFRCSVDDLLGNPTESPSRRERAKGTEAA